MNPWWRDPNWAATDTDLRDASNAGIQYRSDVLSDSKPGGLYILRRPRRVAETVAVKQQIEDLLAAGTPATAIVRVAVDGWSAGARRQVRETTA